MGLGDGVKRELVLSDVKVIEMLMSYRHEYLSLDGAGTVDEDLIVLYADLDKAMERCRFNDVQKSMIRLLEEGYNDLEVSKELDLAVGVVRRRFNTIFRQIKRENDLLWEKWLSVDRFNLKTKKCTTCLEELPATLDFFRANSGRYDGFRARCKSCENQKG